jgi:hypothetical protein
MQQRKLFIKSFQAVCLGTAIQGWDLLSIDPTLAQTDTPSPIPAVRLAPALKILAPTPNNVLDIPATTVILQYRVGSTIELKVNDRLVDRSQIGRTETDSTTNLITQTWYGVSLSAGKNTITATTSQGEVATTSIQVTGLPTKIQVSTAETRVPADGRSLVNVEGQLLDESNHPTKQDSTVTLYTTAGEFAGVDANPGLFRDTSSQNCESLYPVYGDTSKVDVLTPSRDSVFVKVESSTGVRGSVPNMAMWGDYNTTEFSTRSQQFTAANRNLHGAKVNYNAGNLLVSGFYGDNVQGFQRDNIAPDGTSGTYFLSQRLVLSGSENLTIESEELDRPGTVVKLEILNRGLDDDIDFDRGTVLLRRPLLRTAIADNGTILVRRLVATYQYANGTNNSIYGGRAQYTID